MNLHICLLVPLTSRLLRDGVREQIPALGVRLTVTVGSEDEFDAISGSIRIAHVAKDLQAMLA